MNFCKSNIICSVIIFLCFFISIPLFAGEKWFIGVNTGSPLDIRNYKISVGYKQKISSFTDDIKDDDNKDKYKYTSYGVDGRFKNNPLYKFDVGYEFDDAGFKFSVEQGKFSFSQNDFDFSMNSFGAGVGAYYKFNIRSRFTPYVGAGLSYYNSQLKLDNAITPLSYNQGEFVWSLNAGLSYNIFDNWAIGVEDNVRYKKGFVYSSMNKTGDIVCFSASSRIVNTVWLNLKYYFW